MNTYLTLEFFNLFFAGILAGLETSAHYGVHGPTRALEEKSQIQLRQGLVRNLRWLVPAFFLPTAVTGIAIFILEGTNPGLFFRIAALLTILIWIMLRIVATVRINSATLEWSPDAPPKDWREQIAKSERFHMVGTWAAILTFAFFLIAMALQLTGK